MFITWPAGQLFPSSLCCNNTCGLRSVQSSHKNVPTPPPFPSWHPPPPPQETCTSAPLPAVYDHTTLAVNIKHKHMGENRRRWSWGGRTHTGNVSYTSFAGAQMQTPGNITCISTCSSTGSSSPLPGWWAKETLLCLHSQPGCPWNTTWGSHPLGPPPAICREDTQGQRLESSSINLVQGLTKASNLFNVDGSLSTQAMIIWIE